jgi:hypothetical protein
VPADVDLRAIVEAWPVLPEPIKADILAMVNAACTGSRTHDDRNNMHD